MDQSTLERIGRYLNQTMDSREREVFERHIASTPELRDEIKIQRELSAYFQDEPLGVQSPDARLVDFFQSEEAAGFRAKLDAAARAHRQKKAWEGTMSKPKASAHRTNRKLLAVAASLLLLIGFFWIDGIGEGSVDSQDLYAAFSQHEPLALSDKSEGGTALALIQSAFNTGQYERVLSLIIPIMDTLPSQDSQWFDLRMAEGIAYMETGQNAKAQGVFRALKDGPYLNAPKSHWSYVLSLLQVDDGLAAKGELRTYLEAGYEYKRREAEELLGRL